jgi:hypothetical protein
MTECACWQQDEKPSIAHSPLCPLHTHMRCTCPVRSNAIGPHTRGCPNHPESDR